MCAELISTHGDQTGYTKAIFYSYEKPLEDITVPSPAMVALHQSRTGTLTVSIGLNLPADSLITAE